MSISHFSTAYKLTGLPSLKKFVLITYADFANELGEAYPSVETVANRTGMNRKTVMKHVAGLIESGYMADTGERKGRSKQIPVYKLSLDSPKNGTLPKTGQSQKVPKRVPKTGQSDSPKNGTQNHHSFNHQETTTTGEASEQRGGVFIFPENLSSNIRGSAETVLAGLEVENANDCLKILSLKMLAGTCKSPIGLLRTLASRAAAGTLDRSGISGSATPTATHASYQDWSLVKQQAQQSSAAEQQREDDYLRKLAEQAGIDPATLGV